MRQFVEIMKSLYINAKVDEQKIIDLFNGSKITKEEKEYILAR